MLSLPAYRRLVARILLIVFSLMLVNGIVFRHAHKLPNGRVISHAHPYWPVGNSPYQPNTHTAHELFWLDTVTNLFFEAPAVLLLTLTVRMTAPVTGVLLYVPPFSRTIVRFLSLRGPPQVG
ncbi:hypothetical protein [Tellurirhabdus rosea]|uniref:hypothetical protein n=1 Tax=Tellurirhabdus rosea TaxID=2674997 RepID=UPI00225213AB|nr:hypothetical protein [Tellurirhabdus rosea]